MSYQEFSRLFIKLTEYPIKNDEVVVVQELDWNTLNIIIIIAPSSAPAKCWAWRGVRVRRAQEKLP